jgi:predicted aminopeptidase
LRTRGFDVSLSGVAAYSTLGHFETQQRHELQVIQLLTRTRDALRRLYASGLAAPQMREQKQAILAAARGSYKGLAALWDERVPFESWFPQGINNAYLASLATYYDCVPGFERELQQAGGDLNTFYWRVRVLARLPREQRDAVVCRKN